MTVDNCCGCGGGFTTPEMKVVTVACPYDLTEGADNSASMAAVSALLATVNLFDIGAVYTDSSGLTFSLRYPSEGLHPTADFTTNNLFLEYDLDGIFHVSCNSFILDPYGLVESVSPNSSNGGFHYDGWETAGALIYLDPTGRFVLPSVALGANLFVKRTPYAHCVGSMKSAVRVLTHMAEFIAIDHTDIVSPPANPGGPGEFVFLPTDCVPGVIFGVLQPIQS